MRARPALKRIARINSRATKAKADATNENGFREGKEREREREIAIGSARCK